MTVLVGVRCTDGVVVGADSIATSAMGPSGLIQIPTDKIKIVGDRVIVAGTGAVGLGQRFTNIVDHQWSTKAFQKPCWDCLKGITAAAVNDFNSTGTPRSQQYGFGFGAMVAAPLDDDAKLVEFAISDMQPELKDGKINFVSMGSGQALADPFLAFAGRVLWGDDKPDVATAMFGVLWTLSHTITLAPGGVGGAARIAVLQRQKGSWKARLLEDAELQEQSEHIQQIEQRISDYPRAVFRDAQTVPLPTPPTL